MWLISIKNWRAFRFAIPGLCLSLVSACVDHSDVPPGLTGIDRYKIAAPSFENLDELEEIAPVRKKVSRVQVTAPRAGDFITEITARLTQGSTVMRFQSHYSLKEDMEPVTREASQYLFEIDPGAERYAKISVTARAVTALDKSSFCNPWVTNLTVVLEVTEVAGDGSEVTTSHNETVEETTCSTLFPLPFSGHIEDPLEEAFQKAVIKAIKERASGSAPGFSVALSN